MIAIMKFAADWAAKGAVHVEILPMEGSFLELTVGKTSGSVIRFAVDPNEAAEAINDVVAKWLGCAA